MVVELTFAEVGLDKFAAALAGSDLNVFESSLGHPSFELTD